MTSYFDNCFKYSFIHGILADPRQKNIEKIIYDTNDESLLIEHINGVTKQYGKIIRIIDEAEYIEECNIFLYSDQYNTKTSDSSLISQSPFSEELQKHIHNDKHNLCKCSFDRIRAKYKDESLTDDDIRTKYETKTSLIAHTTQPSTDDKPTFQERNAISSDPFIYIPLYYTPYKTVTIPINCTTTGCSNTEHDHTEQNIQMRCRYMKLKYGQIKIYIIVNKSSFEENQRRIDLISEIKNVILYDN